MKIMLLDYGYVQVIDTWGSDARIIEAARMSTGKGFEGWEKDFKLLKYLYAHKHMTPFEMCGATFEIKAPIMVFREWHRHRTQSYNEMSARYIPLPNENYLPGPSDLVDRSKVAAETKNRQASGTGVAISYERANNDITLLKEYYDHGQELYEQFLANGWPKELARLVTPVGRYSKMRASANLRNWLQFLTLRLDKSAQQEIREYAEAVAHCLKLYFPKTMELFDEAHQIH